MSRLLFALARYRKAVVALAGSLLVVAVQVQPLVHGTAAAWLAVGIAAATAITTGGVRNASPRGYRLVYTGSSTAPVAGTTLAQTPPVDSDWPFGG